MRADFLARDRLALVELLGVAFDDAAALTDVHVRAIRIGREVVRIRFAGPALVDRLMRAFGPVEVDPSTAATATIDAWDTASTGRPLPLLIGDVLQALDAAWLTDRGPRGEMVNYSGGPVRAAYYGPGLLSTFDVAARRGQFWLPDARNLPWYEPGSPFRVLLDWILSGPTRHLVHAGAIGGPDGGILLGGAGGSGKSTTALSCIGAPGLQYVSDDYVAIELGSGDTQPTALNMYSTAKVKTRDDLVRFPELRDAFTSLDANDSSPGEHPVLFVHEHRSEFLAPSTPIRAIVFPRYLALDECTVDNVEPSVAFRLLAPSTIQQVPTDTGVALRFMKKLTSRVPAFRLNLARDVEQIPGVIARISESVR